MIDKIKPSLVYNDFLVLGKLNKFSFKLQGEKSWIYEISTDEYIVYILEHLLSDNAFLVSIFDNDKIPITVFNANSKEDILNKIGEFLREKKEVIWKIEK